MRLTLLALAFTTVLFMVTWPSLAITTRSPRRTIRTVVACMSLTGPGLYQRPAEAVGENGLQAALGDLPAVLIFRRRAWWRKHGTRGSTAHRNKPSARAPGNPVPPGRPHCSHEPPHGVVARGHRARHTMPPLAQRLPGPRAPSHHRPSRRRR